MYDVVCVAVVDALKDLFHENGSIFFSEFSSCNDLIKQFTSLANSKDVKLAKLLGLKINLRAGSLFKVVNFE